MTWAIVGAINVAMESQLCHPETGVGKEGLARVLGVIFEGMAAAGRKGSRKGGRR
jgi:hypothetical protein